MKKTKKVKKMQAGGSTSERQDRAAFRADRANRQANASRIEPMSFLEAGTPIRYLAAKMLERRENRRSGVAGMSDEEVEQDRPRRRAAAAEADRAFTDTLGRKKGGMIKKKAGGKVRGDGACQRGRTKGRFV